MRYVVTVPSQYATQVAQQFGVRNCKLLPPQFLASAGQKFPIVEQTKYLGILMSFGINDNSKTWRATIDSIAKKIKTVNRIARHRKSLLTFKTEQVFVASVFRYYSMPYILAGRIPAESIAELWT